MPTPDPMTFRSVMGRFAASVTVMTAVADDEPHGMTANAVSSVSLDPPLVLVCVERDTLMHDVVQRSGSFALSFLRGGQEELSNRFAFPDRPSGHAMFEGVPVRTGSSGSPLLDDALAYVDCTIWAVYDGGDHSIVVGEVIDTEVREGDTGLVYFLGDYADVQGQP